MGSRERIGYLRELRRARIGRMYPRDEVKGYGVRLRLRLRS